jgi:hypothetical protein
MGMQWHELQDMETIPAPAGTATPRTQHATEDGITVAYGSSVPDDASTGYAPGCSFVDVSNGIRYINEGSSTSCDFNKLVSDDFAPSRSSSTGYAYGLMLDGDGFFTGEAASKSYLLGLSGDRDSAYAATGDSNDAILKISGSNYAACDTNFIFRGLNAAINNRSGGTLGRIDHSLGSQGKSGGTVGSILGLTITAENYGTVSDLFGGLDIVLKNEAAVATKEFGIRVRNENNSIAGPVNSVIDISETGANTGFTYLFNIDAAATVGGYASTGDAPALATGDVMVPVRVGSSTYYLVLLADAGA